MSLPVPVPTGAPNQTQGSRPKLPTKPDQSSQTKPDQGSNSSKEVLQRRAPRRRRLPRRRRRRRRDPCATLTPTNYTGLILFFVLIPSEQRWSGKQHNTFISELGGPNHEPGGKPTFTGPGNSQNTFPEPSLEQVLQASNSSRGGPTKTALLYTN